MSYKQHLLDSMEKEVMIIKHLYTKIPNADLSYRPAENMRTALELLQYMAWCGDAMVAASVSEDAEKSMRELILPYRDEAQKIQTGDDFLAAMDQQYQNIDTLMTNITDEDLVNKEAMFPWGEKAPLGFVIMNSAFKYLAAYRMQLFLYAKMAGNTEINTMNCWLGKDYVPPKKTA